MILVPLIAIFIFLILWKKRKEVGKTWDGPVSATVAIKDINLKCTHCGHDKFGKREALLNTSWISYLQLSFLNQSGCCFVCKNCGFLHWFVYPNEKAEVAVETNQLPD